MVYRKRATPAPFFKVPAAYNPVTGQFAPIGEESRPAIILVEMYDDVTPNPDSDGFLAWPTKIDESHNLVRDDTCDPGELESGDADYMKVYVGPCQWRCYGSNHTYSGSPTGDPDGAFVYCALWPDGKYYIIGGQSLATIIMVTVPEDVDESETFTVTECVVCDDGQDPTGGVGGELTITNYEEKIDEGVTAKVMHDGDGGYVVFDAPCTER